ICVTWKSTGSGGATGPSIGLCRRGIDVVGVETNLIVDLALLGIAENVIGLGDLLESLFCFLVAGIDVGMILARKFAESFANLVRRGVLLDAQRCVIIFALSSHLASRLRNSAA